jgi:hypothetical protein
MPRRKASRSPIAMAKAKEQFNAFDHNRDGKLDTAGAG